MNGRVERFGAATLYLGDCRDVIAAIPPIEVLITDPPYGMDFKSNHRIQDHERIAGDTDAELLRFACGIHSSHSSYVFCRWDNLIEVPKPKSLITWVKNNWSMGDLEHEHARQTEVVLFYAGPAHRFPKDRPTDVVEAPRTSNENHPTEKPIILIEKMIAWTIGTVTDPFMGSGTTGVAALKAGKQFIGIEQHEPYFNIACRRIEAASKQDSLF